LQPPCHNAAQQPWVMVMVPVGVNCVPVSNEWPHWPAAQVCSWPAKCSTVPAIAGSGSNEQQPQQQERQEEQGGSGSWTAPDVPPAVPQQMPPQWQPLTAPPQWQPSVASSAQDVGSSSSCSSHVLPPVGDPMRNPPYVLHEEPPGQSARHLSQCLATTPTGSSVTNTPDHFFGRFRESIELESAAPRVLVQGDPHGLPAEPHYSEIFSTGRRRRDGKRSMQLTRGKFALSLSEQLAAGGSAMEIAIQILLEPGLVRKLAFETAGCRTVQSALELASHESAIALARDMHGCVADATRSPHANFVIQKIIRVVTMAEVPFIVEELLADGPDLACHDYGCRIYCRLVEYAASDPRVHALIDGLLVQAPDIVRNNYGHFVSECILDHGLPHQRHVVVSYLCKNMVRNMKNRNASFVVEKAIMTGTPQDHAALMSELIKIPVMKLATLVNSQVGVMVMRAFLRLPKSTSKILHDHMQSADVQSAMRHVKGARRLAESQQES